MSADEALAGQILSRAQLGPGSSDVRAIRHLTKYSGFQERLNKTGHLYEDIWRRAPDPKLEEKNLRDLVVLSPVSSGRSPLSASLADRGLLFKILLPFFYLFNTATTIWIFIRLVFPEVFGFTRSHRGRNQEHTANVVRDSIDFFSKQLTTKQGSRHLPPEAENENTAIDGERLPDSHLPDARTSFKPRQTDQPGPRAPRSSSEDIRDNQRSEISEPHASELENGPASSAGSTSPPRPSTEATARTTAVERPIPRGTANLNPTESIHMVDLNQDASDTAAPRKHHPALSPRRNGSSSTRARRYPSNEPVSATSYNSSRLHIDSSENRGPGQTLPTREPRGVSTANPIQERLESRFYSQEREKEYSRELSKLDRDHGPDLKSSVLSALLTTLPVLVLYYIRSLPFRLLAVILFTLTFAIALSLTYRPKRGEVFATTAA